MPAAVKRRKVTATSKNASSSLNKPRGLDAFTTVSKASSTDKLIVGKNQYADIFSGSQLEPKAITGSKRKIVNIEEEAVGVISQIIASTFKDREIKPLPRRSNDSPRTPQKLIAQVSLETSTKGAKGRLNHLFAASKVTVLKSPSPELPAELLDLINLHAAFLTALSLHYAHNGTQSPADLRLLCPDVARVWGKRRVTLEDIRRTLGVMNTNMPKDTKGQKISRLSLSDYGHGKICIEIQTVSEKAGTIARPVTEDMLNEIYVGGLKKIWEDKVDIDMKAKEFIEGLPIEAIRTCSSLTKMSPLLAKGQRRLEDLKAGIMIKKETAKEKAKAVETNGTKPTLLERLRAKQILQASLPPPLSKAQLARKAALHRIEEVAGVLTMLSTSSSIGQQRVSFTMPTVLGKLRDSFKTPMSKEEGDTCVRLLAAEIAPDWVKMVKIGKVEALVVNRDGRPTELEIRESVKLASMKL
jgi:hypothetical protein